MNPILVRHGETIENRDNIKQGQSPGKLSKLGKEQAKLIAKRLKREAFHSCIQEWLNVVECLRDQNTAGGERSEQATSLLTGGPPAVFDITKNNKNGLIIYCSPYPRPEGQGIYGLAQSARFWNRKSRAEARSIKPKRDFL